MDEPLFKCRHVLHSITYRVNVKGSVFKVNTHDGSTDDMLIDNFDVQVYIATFWINIQQFWESNAQTMLACPSIFI